VNNLKNNIEECKPMEEENSIAHVFIGLIIFISVIYFIGYMCGEV